MPINERRTLLGAALGLLLALAGPARAADDKTLNVYNWSDYIGEHVVAEFEKQYGVKVNYDTYDQNETLEAKLSAGSAGYDIAVPTLSPFLARGIKSGLYEKLDKSKLPNFKLLDPVLLERMRRFDPGNDYAIPWITATIAIASNSAKVRAIAPDAPVDSLAIIFDPKWAAKFKGCGFELLDSPTEIMAVALHYLHLDPDTDKPADIEAAAKLLQGIRPFVRKFDSSGYINDLANGDACVALGYSTDIAIADRRAHAAGKPYSVQLAIPKEGTLTYMDTMAVPKGAPHFDLAMQWLDFVMQPVQMADTTNFAGGRNGVPDSKRYMDPAISGNPGLFPPPEVEKTLFTIGPSTPAVDRLRNRAWTRLKSGH